MRINFHTDGSIPDPSSNTIFVFGSNMSGRHGKGAALIALQKFKAIYGNGVGFQGQSYAIPTKDEQLKTLSLVSIYVYIEQFFINIVDNKFHDDYFITSVGCGLAGYKPYNIAPIFNLCLEAYKHELNDISFSFPLEWEPYINS